jgi:thiamine-phosphate pyrophosphorylase
VREILRALDAAANRAGEALRVIEDVARFWLDDARAAREARAMRHALAACASAHRARLLDARDVRGDVGAAAPTRRAGPPAVSSAAFRRLAEALRSIEEHAALFDRAWSRAAARARFRAYDLERRLLPVLDRRARFAPVRLIAIVTDEHGDPVRAAREALAGGAQAVQWRPVRSDDRRALAIARRLAALCRGRALFFVNDRADLARACGADGVHVGARDLPVAAAREVAGIGAIVGCTTHTLREARRAVRAGADYISVGPMFPSRTKPDVPPRGRSYVRAALRLGVPVVAIGGIGSANVAILARAGVERVAVCEAVARGGRREVARILRALRRARSASR